MINVAQSAAFEAVFESGETGLIPGLEVAVIDNDGATVIGPTTDDLTEQGVTGVYIWNAPAAPADLGQYTIVWSRDGSFTAASVSVEDLNVLTAEDAEGQLPSVPTDPDGGVLWGPCSSWTDPASIDEVCSLPESSSPFEVINLLTEAAASASQILWGLSGRQFSGTCQKTVRPCSTGCMCGVQVLSRGHVVTPWTWGGNSWYCDGRPCGCSSVSEIKLSGYPIRDIVQVTIDGDVVSDDEYFVRDHRYLARKNGAQWPSCQRMDVGNDEDGSFAVTYTYGQSPPQIGRLAAAQLACQLFKATTGADDCVLPSGARRVTRQGITIDATFFNRDEDGKWATGMPFVDGFLAAVNPSGIVRRPTVWAPGPRYPRRLT